MIKLGTLVTYNVIVLSKITTSYKCQVLQKSNTTYCSAWLAAMKHINLLNILVKK